MTGDILLFISHMTAMESVIIGIFVWKIFGKSFLMFSYKEHES